MDDLLSMLHMYRKYQYDGLLELALRRLNIEFPTNFAQFKQKYQTHIRVCIDAGELKGKCGLMVCREEVLVKVINFAVEHDIKSVLPVGCFLACLTFSLKASRSVHYDW